MKTIYNQSDAGKKASGLHPLIKPLLTVIMLLTLGMSVMALPVTHTMIGSPFCYNAANTTTMGLDGGTPGLYHVLIHFRPDGTIIEKTLVLPTTADPFNFVVNYGAIDGSQGLYVTYIYTYLEYQALTSGYPANLLLDLAKVQDGERQNGEVWIYSTPTVYTLNPYGTSYTTSTGPVYVFCTGTAGVTLNDSELSAYAYLETAGVIANDNWEVDYKLFKNTIFVPGSTLLGTGNAIDWTGLDAAPNTYTVTATRVGGCLETSMTGSIELNDQATVKNINTNLCFLSIQEAIDEATTLDGHTLWCLVEQVYTENLTIDKELTLMPDPGLLGFVDIDGSINILDNNVTVQNFSSVTSTGPYAFRVNGFAGYTIQYIGTISSADYGIFIAPDAGGGTIANNQFSLNSVGVLVTGSIMLGPLAVSGPLTISDNYFEGNTPPNTNQGIYNNGNYTVISGNEFVDVLIGVVNYGNVVEISGGIFGNISPAGTGVLNFGTGVNVFDNNFSFIGTTAIESSVALNAVSNWYGDPTGPTILSNPCGLGSAIVGTLVVYSPWWYEAGMTTLNGLTPVSLTPIPDMSTITYTPLIISVTAGYQSDISNYNPAVLTDARIASLTAFPAGAKVTSVKYNGTEVLPADYSLTGSLVYLSDMLGGAYPLAGENGLTNSWEIVIEGFDVPWTSAITFDAVSYIGSYAACNNVLGSGSFDIAFDDAVLAINETDVEVCTGVDNPVFSVDITYPAIVNLDTDVKTDARITSSMPIPANTEIQWSYNGGMASGSYLVTSPTSTFLLSTIVGLPAASLQGHVGTHNWAFEIVNLPVNTYNLTIDALAVLDMTEYIFESGALTLTVHPLPTAALSVVGPNHICTGGLANFSVDFTGSGPWTFTYTDGTTPVTVTTPDDPYTFSIAHTANKTWTISNVTDLYCSNTGTGTVKIYIGTVTYVGTSYPVHPCEGSLVNIPITVDNFDDVGALSLTLNYNDAALEFVSFTQNSSLIAFFFNVLGSTPNTIKIGGYSSVSNVLDNGDTLCTLQFIYKGGSSNLHWDIINPDACEYYSLDYGIFCDTPPNLYYIDGVSPLSGYLRPKAHVSNPVTPVCSGASPTFQVDLIGVQPWSFTYEVNGGSPVTVTGITSSPYYVTVTPTSVLPALSTDYVYTPVDVSDFNGCTPIPADLTGSATIKVNSKPGLTLVPKNVTCYGANDGKIALTVEGNPTFSYNWFDGVNTYTTEDLENLAPVTYWLTVTDGNGCVETAAQYIDEPDQLSATVGHTDVTCFGGSDGIITITNPLGGWGGHEFGIVTAGALPPTTWQTGLDFNGLAAGDYDIYMKDASLILPDYCERRVDTETVGQPDVLSATVSKTDVTCNGADDGTITVSDPLGGHGTWDVSIDGFASFTPLTILTPVIFQNLEPGDYTVSIRDASHILCVIDLPGIQTIAEPDALAATVSKTDITCFGADDGTITINGATGGWGAIEFSIDGGVVWQPSNVFNDLAPTGLTDHSVFMRSVLHPDCDLDLGFIEITEPAELSGTVTSTVMSCHDANDATITVSNPGGGYGTYEVSINGVDWYTLVTAYTFENLSAGVYDVVIRDAVKTTCEVVLEVEYQIVNPPVINVQGNISYFRQDNSGNYIPGTVVAGVTVDLRVNNTVVKTGTTDGSGNYYIANVCPDDYEIRVSYGTVLSAAKDPVNVTDAAQVSQWKVCPGTCPIEKVKFYAGDVIMTNEISNPDPTQIWNYFLSSGLQTWFGRDRWTFWPVGETISDNPLTEDPIMVYDSLLIEHGHGDYTQNFYALYTGDFNGSFTGFGVKATDASNLRLDVAQTMMVEPGTEFELPIMAGSSMDVRAVSLLLNFPSDKLEIVGAYLSDNAGSPVSYNLTGDELRLGWMSSSSLNLNTGDRLMTLKLRLTAPLAKDERIQLTLNGSPLNELADGNVQVISNAVLYANQIGSSATGIIENNASAGLGLANYPNPFNETTTFAYTLPFDGVVTLDVYDMLGNKVNGLLNESMTAGTHKLTINSNTLKPGVYTATMSLNKDGQLLKRTIKIVRNQ